MCAGDGQLETSPIPLAFIVAENDYKGGERGFSAPRYGKVSNSLLSYISRYLLRCSVFDISA